MTRLLSRLLLALGPAGRLVAPLVAPLAIPLAIVLLIALAIPSANPAAAQTLAAVQARGALRCGVFGTLPGFSAPDPQGVMRGLDADYCRAVAAAVLGDAGKVRFESFAAVDAGLTALAEGRIDVLARNATLTLGRSAPGLVEPVGVLFFDGQGVLVRRSSGIGSIRQLAGRVCVTSGGGVLAERLLARYAREAALTITAIPAADSAAAFAAFRAGQCDAVSGDASALATRRITELPNPDETLLLPELISREPLGPWVKSGDAAWHEALFWVLQALLNAEELDITAASLVTALQGDDPETRAFLGLAGGPPVFGLPADWAAQVVRQVGNYGEIYARNLGTGSGIGLNRGLNDLWLRGGLHYPLPMR